MEGKTYKELIFNYYKQKGGYINNIDKFAKLLEVWLNFSDPFTPIEVNIQKIISFINEKEERQ